MRDADLLGLIDLAYSAAVNVDEWPAFLRTARTVFSSADASLLSHNLPDSRPGVAVTTLDAESQRAYLATWGREDPWARSARFRTLQAGSVVAGEQLVPTRALERTAFHHEFGRRIEVERVLLIAIENGPHVVSAFSLSRSARAGVFESVDMEMLTELAPHFRRALQIHRRLAGAEMFANGAASTLDALPSGVVLVGPSGFVLHVNRAANEILEARDGLRIRERELEADSPADRHQLRSLIGSVLSARRSRDAEPGGLVIVRRPSGRQSLRVLVTPSPRHRLVDGLASPAALVFVTDPERIPTPDGDHLRLAFGLSPAETRVALALVAGDSLDVLADRLCISRNTARTHLQRLFRKTATNRQSELIRALLAGDLRRIARDPDRR